MPEVRVEEVRRFMVDSLVVVGAPKPEAEAHADLLLYADTVGHFSHGLNRLELYVNDIKGGLTHPELKPVVLKESPATAWVDGMDTLGATAANFCMDLAIKKAKGCGVGWVSAKRTNHFGMAGYWAMKAEKEGLIGLAFTNSAPIMIPTRSKESACGTNPLALAAPALNGDSLVVDMATTTAAMGKIEMQIHKNEPIPEGWALGPDNKTTTNAPLAFDTGKLLPLGGLEKTSGHKGYCLNTMVEIFCSGLSGSNPTYKVPSWSFSQDVAPDLGQCFAAIDPDCFAPGFGQRVAECLMHWRNLEPLDPSLPVLAPGDKERNNREATLKRGTIIYPQGQIDSYHRMAKNIGISPLTVV
ncbi:PREDICTED: (2R)-3-sulfolactate dehydrogenase (NADP(+))-like [Papilio polytes]|uniref:(2R)-3-sulfolactate dehydrogenase (NADP(+))-like n=1 Tax=Papilio polytes TaxID=76194 RepID=UPI0006764BBE|nr:PREDICTED: (2R)-3-sulfolactate dehydrogenase (NADP(+))-like [Papilio polytes]